MYSVARAYSLAQASVVAPFEYVALLINVMWGFLIWREIPTLATWTGALLTIASGAYILYRERRERPLAERLVRYSDESEQITGHENSIH